MFDADGLRPDPENVKAMQKMPALKDVSSLSEFLSLNRYYSIFLLDLHRVCSLQNKLLQKEQTWCWPHYCSVQCHKERF